MTAAGCARGWTRKDPASGEVRLVSACGALGTDERSAIETISDVVHFAPKQTMLRQDDPADCMYNITTGTVRLYRLLADGRRQVIGFLLPGDFLGLSLAERHAVSADAIDAVSANRFRRVAFSHLIDEKPRLLRRVYEATTHELTVAHDHVVLLGRRTAEQKVAGFLLSMRERYRSLGAGGVTLRLPMTRQDIADYLGLTLETVSRTISKLQRQHIVLVVPDGLRVVDPAALEALGSH
jgi:CRP/FNR family transcriptional regulator